MPATVHTILPLNPASVSDADWLRQEAAKFQANDAAWTALITLGAAGSTTVLKSITDAIYGSNTASVFDARSFSEFLQGNWIAIADRLTATLTKGAITVLPADAQALREEATRLSGINFTTLNAAIAQLVSTVPASQAPTITAIADATRTLRGDADRFASIATGIDALLQGAKPAPTSPSSPSPGASSVGTPAPNANASAPTSGSSTGLVVGLLAVAVGGGVWWVTQRRRRR